MYRLCCLALFLSLPGCGPSIQVVRMGRQLSPRPPGCGATLLDVDPQAMSLTMETVGSIVIDAPVPLGAEEQRALSEQACSLGARHYVAAISAGGRSTFFAVVPRRRAAPAPARPAGRPARPIVAVVPLNDRAGLLSPRERETLDLYLATQVAGTGRFRVVPPQDVKARLVEEKRGSYRECYDTRCQIELGRALAAQKTVASMLLRVGQRCTLSVNLYDLKTETSEAAASVDLPCSADGVRTGIDDVARKLGADP